MADPASAATAKRLAELGAKVTIFDRAQPTAATAETGAAVLQVDVTDEAQVAEALLKAEAAHGIARILVNCAGVVRAIRILDNDGAPHGAQAFREMIEVNLVGTFVTIAQFAARLAQAPSVGAERGVVVNTASIAAYDGQGGQAAYSASKAGVVGLTLPAARDLAPHGIRVVSIAPGYFLTGMTDQLPAAMLQALADQPPHPRPGRPRRVRPTGREHHRQSDAQRRGDPAGRRAAPARLTRRTSGRAVRRRSPLSGEARAARRGKRRCGPWTAPGASPASARR